MDTIKRKITLNKYKCNDYDESHWGMLTGKTESDNIIYYSGQTGTTAILLELPILITQTIDDMGVFIDIYDYTGETSTGAINEVSFIGESNIDEFRRYSKNSEDSDLYNAIENSGFTKTIKQSNGLVKKIKGSKTGVGGEKQVLYDYVLGANQDDLINSGIHYSDIGNDLSEIKYITSGLTSENSLSSPQIKLDYLLGVIEQPKIKSDVFIDRGVNGTFYKNLILGEIRSVVDMETYGDGKIKIIDN